MRRIPVRFLGTVGTLTALVAILEAGWKWI